MSYIKQAFLFLFFFCFISINNTIASVDNNIDSIPNFGDNSNYGPVYTSSLLGRDSTLKKNAELLTIDQNYLAYREFIVKTHKVKNLITFSIDEQGNRLLKTDFRATIFLDVTVKKAGVTEQQKFKKSLTVDYKIHPDSTYQAINYYPFEGGVEVSIKVDSIITNATSWDVTKVLSLKNDIQAQREMAFSCSITNNSEYFIGINKATVVDFGELQVTCNKASNNFPNEYDIEWTWVDESAFNATTPVEVYFDNNATRVTKATNTYNIPLLYDGKGRLFIRFRCVQQLVNGHRLEGNWVYNIQNSNAPAFYEFTGHESNLNWQATTSFAEDGKRKSVVQYFDGSLRGRQTVTKDNQTNTTVVAETFYDYQGRPLIQVLPAPTLNNIIAFTKNFNQFDDASVGKAVYDLVSLNKPIETVCNKVTAKLNNTTGSSFYYSPEYVNSTKNPKNIGDYDKFIPNADGRPYTETKYTDDGTGRIEAQGGVGTMYQLNNGRDTKYYYESPAQNELDALFGTDAGEASHYFKNWVKDANGQYSVSYVDMHGRTVATSLAGKSPTNLVSLNSESTAAKKVTDQLIDNETNRITGKSMVSSKSLVVPIANDYTFSYSFTPPTLSIPNCDKTKPNNIYNCVFDVTISIIPDCTEKIRGIVNKTPGVVFKNNLANTGISFKISRASTVPVFQLNLPEGSYTIIKELEINEDAYQKAKQDYIATNLCKTLQEFKNEQTSLALAQLNCNVTCESCTTSLGTKDEFKEKIVIALGMKIADVNAQMQNEIDIAYAKAKEVCDKLCNTGDKVPNEIASIEQMMLNDVTPPYGQYAKIDKTPAESKYNIFDGTHHTITPYLNPLETSFTASTHYKDANGNNELVKSDLSKMSKVEFTNIFKKSYAYQLLPYHPEFCKLNTMKTKLQAAFKFAEKLDNINTWAEAEAQQLVSPGSLSATGNRIETKDPLFNTSLSTYTLGTTYTTNINKALYQEYQEIFDKDANGKQQQLSPPLYLSMWQVALMGITCRDALSNYEKSKTPTDKTALEDCLRDLRNNTSTASNISAMCKADKDMLWKNFKSFYLTYRRKLINDYLNIQANLTCPNPILGAQTNKEITNASGTPRIIDVPVDKTGSTNTAYNNLVSNSTNGEFLNNNLLESKEATCNSNIQNWINWLMECDKIKAYSTNSSTWKAELDFLITTMTQICVAGVSLLDHPMGASSLQSGSLLSEKADPLNGQRFYFSSIPQLLQHFFSTRNIPYSEICHPYLITFPPPYQNSTPLVNHYVVTKPSDCECARLNAIKSQMVSNPIAGVTNLSEYLKRKHGTTISQADINLLDGMCNNTLNCKFLEKPLELPPVLQCKDPGNASASLNTCIDCSEYNFYRSQIPPVLANAPYKEPSNQSQLNANIAFAKFMNFKTGFTKTWQDYSDFGEKCETNINCSLLKNLIEDYKKTPAYLQSPTGTNCKDNFVVFMNNALGVVYTYSEWVAIITNTCGEAPDVCLEKVTCTTIENIMTDFYKTNSLTSYKNPNFKSILTAYFNIKLSANLTYNNIIEIANKLGCCSQGFSNFDEINNSHLLVAVYNRFKSQYNVYSLTQDNCEQLFTNYFNAMLGLQITNPGETPQNTKLWSDIHGFYGEWACNRVDIRNLCSPPFSCDQLEVFLKNNYDKFDVKVCDLQGFVAEFNNHFNTDYTLTKIKALYGQLCGIDLPQCNMVSCDELAKILESYTPVKGATINDCKQAFVVHFNQALNTNYTYIQIQDIFNSSDCGLIFSPCETGGPSITDCNKLQEFIKSFNDKFPNAKEEFGNDCSTLFLDYFANFFNVERGLYTLQDVLNMLRDCKIEFSIPCEDHSVKIAEFMTEYSSNYMSLKIPAIARQQLFRMAYNTKFYNNPNEGLSYDEVFEICTSVANSLNTNTSTSNPCQNLNSLQCILYKLTNEDPAITLSNSEVLQSMKMAYYLLHPYGLPEDCTNDFASFVNVAFHSTLRPEEIANIYESVIGKGASNICNTATEDQEAYIVLREGSAITEGTSATLNFMLCGNNTPLFNNYPIVTPPCKDKVDSIAWVVAENKYELYVQDKIANFETQFLASAFNKTQLNESFTKNYTTSEHHFTLYFYDQAGSLVKTVPPAGVDNHSNYKPTLQNTTTTGRDLFVQDVKAKRRDALVNGVSTTNKLQPLHVLETHYRYNTLNQVVEQKTPDAGISRFWYDRLGRLVVSQNDKQFGASRQQYSYTWYDELGRIAEVGQIKNRFVMTNSIAKDPAELKAWLQKTSSPTTNYATSNPGTPEQVTRTFYDVTYLDGTAATNLVCPSYICQTNLRNRVSYTAIYPTIDIAAKPLPQVVDIYSSATIYSYDIHGNVHTLLQDFGNYATSSASYRNNMMVKSGNRFKTTVYDYDLISGKVNVVSYQPNQPDQFYHKYSYDAENKLTFVETSADGIMWEKDATYYYYKHGPLAKTILGHNQVQGLDYAYTLQGWLKGVNSTFIAAAGAGTNATLQDMGQDGLPFKSQVARDVYGFALNYYTTDYQPIGGTAENKFAAMPTSFTTIEGETIGAPLFNGNISSMLVNIPKLGAANVYAYRYDQLNRIIGMNTFTGLSNTNTFSPIATNDYKERVSYDANGNILTYFRNGKSTGGTSLPMDNLIYKYPNDGKENNRLKYVFDEVSATNYSTDIDNQTALSKTQVELDKTLENPTTDNYVYDEIGNLIKDKKEGVELIEWTVYGKIDKITKTNGTIISYTYDASGNRISKTVTPANGLSSQTWYVRDASGNVMSIYQSSDISATKIGFYQTEIPLYGSSRLGVNNINRLLWTATNRETTIGVVEEPIKYQIRRASKVFELSNHLGNVLVTISDRKLGISTNGTTIDYYEAIVVTAQDYYPFGMTMPGRTYNAGTGYRYGFNGQEKSNDVTEGNYTAEFWEYDSRTGRRWNTDPVLKPNISSYGTLGNNPIMFVDKNGDDWFVNHLGFYIWSDDANVMLLGFTQYAGTSLPSNVPRYKILTYIETETNFGKQNLLYHKYHYSGLKKFINWLCGAKNITNKEYSPHNEMMSEEFAGMAISYGVFKAAGFAYQAIKASAGSIWKLPGWLERGFVYEAMKGANLPKGFKTIDKFVKGVATSIKTLDLKADTYIKAGKVFGKLKEYIDELDAFKGAKRKGVEVLEQDVKEKVLDVAIPKGATKSQVEEIQKAIQYGKDKGIKVETTVIK